jgi:Flp pilus assembly protein TadD
VPKSILLAPKRPDAFKLLGALIEIRGDRIEAHKDYRAALSLDPSYAAAIKNLDRATSWGWKQAKGIILEEKKDVNEP